MTCFLIWVHVGLAGAERVAHMFHKQLTAGIPSGDEMLSYMHGQFAPHCAETLSRRIAVPLQSVKRSEFWQRNFKTADTHGVRRLIVTDEGAKALDKIDDWWRPVILPGQVLTAFNGKALRTHNPLQQVMGLVAAYAISGLQTRSGTEQGTEEMTVTLSIDAGADFLACWNPLLKRRFIKKKPLEAMYNPERSDFPQPCKGHIEVVRDAMNYLHFLPGQQLPVFNREFRVQRIDLEGYLFAKDLMRDLDKELESRSEEVDLDTWGCQTTSLTPLCAAVVAPDSTYLLVMRDLPGGKAEEGPSHEWTLHFPADALFSKNFPTGLNLGGCGSRDAAYRLGQDSDFLRRHGISGYGLHVRMWRGNEACTCDDPNDQDRMNDQERLWPVKMDAFVKNDHQQVVMGIRDYVPSNSTTPADAAKYRERWMEMWPAYFRMNNQVQVNGNKASFVDPSLKPTETFFVGELIMALIPLAWVEKNAVRSGSSFFVQVEGGTKEYESAKYKIIPGQEGRITAFETRDNLTKAVVAWVSTAPKQFAASFDAITHTSRRGLR